MANYHYSSVDGSSFVYNGPIADIPVDYNKYEDKSFGESTLYYFTDGGKVTDIVAESEMAETYARKEVFEAFEFVKTIA